MFSVALALISDAFRGRDRGAAFAVFGATTGVSVAVGPVLGGIITTDLSWRWIFFVNVPLGLVAFAITLLRVSESPNLPPRGAQPLKSLRRSHLMHQVQIDVQNRRPPRRLRHQVGIPNFLEHSPFC